MPTEFLAVEDGGLQQAARGGHDRDSEVEDTPRSEVPPQLTVITPSAFEATAKQNSSSNSNADGDYFTLASATALDSVEHRSASSTGHDFNHPGSSTSKPHHNISAPIGFDAASSDATPPGYTRPADELRTRPTPQQTISSLSIESTESSATVRPARPSAPTRAHITFPNQSFSALHHQQYPAYHIAPAQRRAGVHGAPINTFACAIGSQHFPKAQTSHNSPAVTPNHGLFSTTIPPPTPTVESEASSGTYSSPFLHPAHRQRARDTHVAEVELDPISGRKLINQYEIVDELGRGTHGKVKLGRDLNEGGYVAIKIVERFSKRRKLGRLGTTEDKVKKEVAILKKARHPNVVALLEVIDDPSRKKVYIVLEWLERGEIKWRIQGPREIAMVEARRYQREKNEAMTGRHDERLAAEDKAVLDEAKHRLEKQKRQRSRKLRQLRRGVIEAPEAWSHEMAGDGFSEESEEDRLSRISSITGDMTVQPQQSPKQWLDTGSGRKSSRITMPLQPALDTTVARPSTFLRLTAEPETMSPVTNTVSEPLPVSRSGLTSRDLTGLEGTMYGAYDPHSDPSSRITSLPSSLRGSQYGSTEDLALLAQDLLDTHLDTELQWVPLMTIDQIRIAFRDTLLGLQYLHQQGIIHRDIKPPNLLSTIDNRVKISDFGVSYLGRPVERDAENEDVSETDAQDQDEARELAKTVGTPAFYAPELCNTDPTDEPLPVTKAIDVWALGITLFCMLFARTPFVDNEFVVMRHICDEEVFIPQQRLQPVDPKSTTASRPSSHSRFAPHRRHDLEFVYEDLGDELMDLLKRLLIKDPRKRITLEDVRHHPWVLSDLQNKMKWLEETDPKKHIEGHKIEISNEELDTAVVPLNMAERLKSIVKKSADAVGRVITGRARGHSSAALPKDGSPAPSAQSSSSNLSQDGRRHSIRDVDFFKALKASRETRESEHPLSNSVAASPELGKVETYVPRLNGNSDSSNRLSRSVSRPSPPHRAMTIASAAGSVRTVTQSDYVHARNYSPPSPGLPGTPHQVAASPGSNHLGGLVTGTARNIMKSMRASSRQRSRNGRGTSSERGSERGSARSYDPHGEASLAVSQTTAAGHMQQPDALRGDASPLPSTYNSPASSRPQSVTSETYLHPETGILSRFSSSSSLASANRHELFRNAGRAFFRTQKHNESPAEDWRRADEERIRKLVREHEHEAEKSNSSSPVAFASPETFDGRTCPTSPDDHEHETSSKRQDSTAPSLTTDLSSPATPDEAISPTNPGQLPPALVSSSSDLGSAVSMSNSNPSIPSAISEASSIDVDGHAAEKADPSSDDTLHPSQRSFSHGSYDEGYTPDEEAVNYSDDPDEDYDDSDSDGGLVMSRGKSATKLPPAERRNTELSGRSKKSSRSGSNNTMKKVRTKESSDEQSRRSMDISEE